MAQTDNILMLGFPNHIDTASLTAGSAVASLPASNVQNRQVTYKWRTDTLDSADTYIEADFTTPQPVSGVAIVGHNLGPDATIRVRIGNDPTFVTNLYDSGVIEAVQVIEPFGSLPWGLFHWGGKFSEDELATMTVNRFLVLPEMVSARYMRIDFVDEANGDGYLEVGRIICGPAVQPTVNMQYGWGEGWEDTSTHSYSRGGQTWSDEQPRRRVLRFTLAYLGENEIFGSFYNTLDRAKGTFGDMFVAPKPNSTELLHNQAFYGRMRTIEPLFNTMYGVWEKAFEIEELL